MDMMREMSTRMFGDADIWGEEGKMEVGARLQARSSLNDEFRMGRVTEVHDYGAYTVAFDDGRSNIVARSDVKPLMIQVLVTVPPGVSAGMTIHVEIPDGRMIQAPIPPGLGPGSEFHVEVPELAGPVENAPPANRQTSFEDRGEMEMIPASSPSNDLSYSDVFAGNEAEAPEKPPVQRRESQHLEGKDARKCAYGVCMLLFAIGLFLMTVLLPVGYSKLEYYEHGIVYGRTNKKVDTSKVYGPGNHHIGPDYHFKIFKTSVYNYEKHGLASWTKASSDSAGSVVTIDFSFQYRFDPKRVGDLYKMFGVNFAPFIESIATSQIRSTAPLFSADQFLLERATIENAFARNVSVAISEVHASLISLQLRRLQFTDEFVATKLSRAIQEQTNTVVEYAQTATVTRGETAVIAAQSSNDAIEIRDRARARAAAIVGEANARAYQRIERARSDALEALYETLGIDNDKQRASADYLLMLTLKAQGVQYANSVGYPDGEMSAFVNLNNANTFPASLM